MIIIQTSRPRLVDRLLPASNTITPHIARYPACIQCIKFMEKRSKCNKNDDMMQTRSVYLLWRYRSHLVILSRKDTYVLVPLLSLGSSTVRSNPLQSTSSHCKINRSSWRKNQISEKKYEAISNHAYKRSKRTQINFMDKKIDLIINSKFTGSQQTHRKKSYIIWISKRPLY